MSVRKAALDDPGFNLLHEACAEEFCMPRISMHAGHASTASDI